jgi:hypothetical protein
MYDVFGDTNARHGENHFGNIPSPPRSYRLFNSLAETLVLGPDEIWARPTVAHYDSICDYELILRVVLRAPAAYDKASWAIYRRTREWEETPEEGPAGCVLRHSVWDREGDYAARAWETTPGPHVLTTVRYFDDSRLDPLMHDCRALDQVLLAGVPLELRPDTDPPSWTGRGGEVEIRRAFNWGLINLDWNEAVRNLACAAAIRTLTGTIEALLHQHTEQQWGTIEAMEMYYAVPDVDGFDLLTQYNNPIRPAP